MGETFDPYAGASDTRYEAMAAIRAAGGVAETPAGYYIATAAGVLAGVKEVDKFVGSFQDVSNLPEDEVPISAIPEPQHGRVRRVINSVVAFHRLGTVDPLARDLARDLLRDAMQSSPVDMVPAYVDPIPSTVIAHVLGVPLEDRDRFAHWSDELLATQQAATETRTLSEYEPEFAAYVQEQIDRRRAMDDPPDDVITRFINTEVDGELLSDDAVRTQTLFLILAGNETTRNLIGNILHRLATMPDLFATLRADRSLIPVAVEESLRFDSPVQVLARAVLADTEIEGQELHVGDRVVFGVASANRDEHAHDDADEFRLDRPRPRDHLGFGAGPHVCPGASLARMEAIVAVDVLCDAVSSLRMVDGFMAQPNPVFWALGHRSLPMILEAS